MGALEELIQEVRETRIMVTSLLRQFSEHAKKHPAKYTRADAARRLQLSKPTISKMIEDGRLKTTSDGRFIPHSEIERYLNEK